MTRQVMLLDGEKKKGTTYRVVDVYVETNSGRLRLPTWLYRPDVRFVFRVGRVKRPLLPWSIRRSVFPWSELRHRDAFFCILGVTGAEFLHYLASHLAG